MKIRRQLYQTTLTVFTLLLGCQSQASTVVLLTPLPTRLPVLVQEPTPMPTPVPTATWLPPATTTPLPTVTTVPTFTPTSTETPTLTPTPWPTPVIVGTPIQRTCPDPPPLKPIYNRYYLSANRWPLPDPVVTQPHFWLSSPFGGGDRLVVNQDYPYGWDNSGRLLLHNGVDSAEKLGTPVLAVGDGVVVTAQSDAQALYGWRCGWYGHLVALLLDQTWDDQPIYVLYGHVLNLMVTVGQRVQRGDSVAEVGFGGVATSPHLHLEVRVGSNEFDHTRNPALWLPIGPTKGLIVGRLLDPEGRPWQGVNIQLLHEGTAVATTWSYLDDPQQLLNPDEGLAENFVFSGVAPGSYELYTAVQGVEYRLPVQVMAGEMITLQVYTEPFRGGDAPPLTTPTPTESNG